MPSNPNQLLVDLSVNTGPLKYGAAGFLYGLGNAGIPSDNMLAPLKPQVAAQKPEGGLQHPNGDALDVSGTYRNAGGREIQIYLQDCYRNWPYEFLGLEDYLEKITDIIRKVVVSPDRGLFSYVPFNEPDQIWYNKTTRKQDFLQDWKTIYQEIKSLDPDARIVGPNYAHYDARFYRQFLKFTRDNACLPDVISWHELRDDFFSGWNRRFSHYRSLEKSLGLPALEVCINEYSRIKGDLGIPGRLVQWVARFEASKVDACLAYWTDAGSLNNLVTRDNYNKATGGWWLFRWYGGMSGHTVKVVSARPNAQGMQGLACLDTTKKQARVIFGGCEGRATVSIKGFDAAPYFGDRVTATVWTAASTGLNPSSGPALIQQVNYTIVDGQIQVVVDQPSPVDAYQIIITPALYRPLSSRADRYEAVFADLSANIKVIYPKTAGDSEACFVQAGFGGEDTTLSFVITAADNGFHTIRIRYCTAPIQGVAAFPSIRIGLNGVDLTDLSIPATLEWDAWMDAEVIVFLIAGINRLAFTSLPGEGCRSVRIASIEVTPTQGPVTGYEAEAPANTLKGSATVKADPSASGGKCVTGIGDGIANILEFNRVWAPINGFYRMVVFFANAEFRGGHSYNSQVVDRFAEIRVNGGAAQKVFFRNTFTWDNYQTRVVDVELNQGANTIQFSNPDAESYAPIIDKIELASPILTSV